MILLDLLSMLLIAYFFGFLYYGLYRIITAKFQRRMGPPVWQSFLDSIKFFSKNDSTSHGWMFYLGPIIMTSGAIMTLIFIPFFSEGKSFIFTREDWILGFVTKAGSYDPDRFDQDKRALEYYYKTLGYIGARLVDAKVVLDPKTKQYTITFIILVA